AAQYKLYRAKPVPGTHEPSGGWLFPFVPGPWPPQGGAQGVYGASFVRGRSDRWRSGGLVPLRTVQESKIQIQGSQFPSRRWPNRLFRRKDKGAQPERKAAFHTFLISWISRPRSQGTDCSKLSRDMVKEL